MKKTLGTIVCLICIFFMCGCGVSKEEEKHLDKITKQSVSYMSEKYGKNFEVIESSFILASETLFPSYSDDILIKMSDETKVIYKSDENKFYDDYQASQISNSLESSIWNPMLEKIKPYGFDESGVEPIFNRYSRVNFYGSFYNSYYDCDINKFIKQENPTISIGIASSYFEHRSIYVISEDNEIWKEKYNIIKETLDTYFPDSYTNFVFLTNELYNKRKSDPLFHVNIGMEGCWAEGNNIDLEIQKYIKISDGIYATSNEKNFDLIDGDITLKEVMTGAELQALIENPLNQSDSTYKELANVKSPVYEFVFSERIKDANAKYGDAAGLDLYIKFVPEELNLSTNNNLYRYRDNGYNYIVATGDGVSKYESIPIFKTRYYYWIGTLEKVNKN